MVKRKTQKTKATKEKNIVIGQSDLVLDYLVTKGRKGATNFEMMMNLHICDVRKCISDLNNKWAIDYTIESIYETADNGKHYKRYWAVPVAYNSLTEWLLLDEGKHTRKVSKKHTGGGKR